jgi:hypothetical protein
MPAHLRPFFFSKHPPRPARVSWETATLAGLRFERIAVSLSLSAPHVPDKMAGFSQTDDSHMPTHYPNNRHKNNELEDF